MVKEIPLSQGKVALVDDEDYDFLMQWKWYFLKARNFNGYAVRNDRSDGTHRQIKMHKLINNTPTGFQTDHINGNKLDNRRCNLRTVSFRENIINRGLQSNNSTGYKGVYFHPKTGKWYSAIGVNGKWVYLGLHKTREQAAEVYNKAAIKHFGEFAVLNTLKEMA